MKEELEDLINQCGNRFKKLTLHSENPKHPNMIWQATPNQHIGKYKRGVRGRSPCEAVKNLLKELNKYN